MRRLAPVAAAALACMPAPALAQDDDAGAHLSERWSDTAEQARMAGTLAALSEVVLSLPIAPLADALEESTGEPVPDIKPDTTLRSLAGPHADRISPGIERNVPRVMGAVAGIAESARAMMPALRGMAARLREAAPQRAR